jgi:hypothetical protein
MFRIDDPSLRVVRARCSWRVYSTAALAVLLASSGHGPETGAMQRWWKSRTPASRWRGAWVLSVRRGAWNALRSQNMPSRGSRRAGRGAPVASRELAGAGTERVTPRLCDEPGGKAYNPKIDPKDFVRRSTTPSSP